jgi:hypothetical protein
VDGPNCFHAALLWYFPELTPSMMSPSEFEARLKNEFVSIEPEAVAPGDLMVIYAPDATGQLAPKHATVMAVSDILWHKAGLTQKAPYEFIPRGEVWFWSTIRWERPQWRVFRRREL